VKTLLKRFDQNLGQIRLNKQLARNMTCQFQSFVESLEKKNLIATCLLGNLEVKSLTRWSMLPDTQEIWDWLHIFCLRIWSWILKRSHVTKYFWKCYSWLPQYSPKISNSLSTNFVTNAKSTYAMNLVRSLLVALEIATWPSLLVSSEASLLLIGV